MIYFAGTKRVKPDGTGGEKVYLFTEDDDDEKPKRQLIKVMIEQGYLPPTEEGDPRGTRLIFARVPEVELSGDMPESLDDLPFGDSITARTRG